MKLQATVDRIEGEYAVLLIRPEEKQSIDWPLTHLPSGLEEGDILSFDIERDEQASEDARQRVQGLIDKLSDKNN